jgi:hypothetical protein
MTNRKRPQTRSETRIYRTFESSLLKLAYFLGTTEKWYGKQTRILRKQVQEARKELSQVETELDELSEKMDRSRLSKAEEKRFNELGERVDDLTDIDIFGPLEAKQFRQFSDLIRVLGLSHLVTVFEAYLADIVREIFLVHPEALKSARQLTAEAVLNLGKRKGILSYLAEKETEELLYKSFAGVVDYFSKKFNINLNGSGIADDRVVEIMATRNIHVHNMGIVSRRYLESVNDSKLKVGAYKPITREYLRDSIASIRTLVQFIDAEVQRKYLST